MVTKRITFYFDGFNFYNGLRSKSIDCSEWKNYYWIDFYKLCLQFIDPPYFISKIKYFTAAPLNIEKQSRWAALMAVNKALNPDVFETIYGKYYKKQILCPLCKDTFTQPEEKRTDVNISVQLIADCVLNLTDSIVLISADSDLVPSLQFIIKHFPHIKLKVYFPPKRNSKDIIHTVGIRRIRYFEDNEVKFQNAILPNKVNIDTKIYTIPTKWLSQK